MTRLQLNPLITKLPNKENVERFAWTKTIIVGVLLLNTLLLIITAACIHYRSSIFTVNVVHEDMDDCNIQLVESIPIGLTYSADSPKFLSTYEAWKILLANAQESVDLGTFYWTLRGTDFYNHSSAAAGESIFAEILKLGLENRVKIRIAQSKPTAMQPNLDTLELAKYGAAEVRSVDFPRLIGGGVLHTKLWIVDNKHFYLGSANMDWRSLTQVKELGILGQYCSAMAQDLQKIFAAYWLLGDEKAVIPKPWPESFSTQYNAEHRFKFNVNKQYTMSAYFSSSPPPLSPNGRTDDLQAILNVIANAKKFIHIAVMDYYPLTIYTPKKQYWPYIDDALRAAAINRKISIKMLISWWKHSNPSEDYFLRSLQSLSASMPHVDIEIKRFIVPSDEDQAKIPFSRVNHNKYMVTDQIAYIGTSNWSGDYFVNTAGIGMILEEVSQNSSKANKTLQTELVSVFKRDWESPYAKDF